MKHPPFRSARQIAFVWRPRPAGGRARRHGGACRVEAVEPRLLLSGSVYDESFGNGGLSKFDFFGFADAALHVLALPDGKIVVGGATLDALPRWAGGLLTPGAIDGDPGHGVLARLNADGTLDESFSDDGLTSYTFPGGASGTTVTIDAVLSLAGQPDGKVLAGVNGYVSRPGAVVEGKGVMAVARFLPDGNLDTAFGHNGLAMTNPRGDTPSTGQGVAAMALQPDGKIVAVGSLGPPAEGASGASDWGDWAVVRFNADGSVDPSFEQQVEDFPDPAAGRQSRDAAVAVTLAPGGKIVVGGQVSGPTGDLFTVARYNADGSKDTKFGQGGYATKPFAAVSDAADPLRYANDLALDDLLLQADGKVVVAASLGRTLTLARYNVDGTIDDSFGTHGLVGARGVDRGTYRARLADDGTIHVSGLGSWASTQAFTATFSPAGTVVSASRGNVPSGPEPGVIAGLGRPVVFAAAVQADGKILAAGQVYPVADAGEGVPWEMTADAMVLRIDPADLTAVTDVSVTPGGADGSNPPPVAQPPVVQPVVVPPPTQYDRGGVDDQFTPPPLPTATMLGKPVVRGGRAYAFRLSVLASASVVRQIPVTVSGPGGFSAAAQLLKVKDIRAPKPGTTVVIRPALAKYKVGAPGGSFDSSDNGTYTVRLDSTTGGTTTFRVVGNFTVGAPARRGAAPVATSTLRRLVPAGATSLLDDRREGAV
jgi:uncharacterized delta-60 repeat protein